jgi:hypothetical protein
MSAFPSHPARVKLSFSDHLHCLLSHGFAVMALGGVLLCEAKGAEPPQYTVSADKKAPQPGTGLVNGWLRSESESFSPWDIGGQVRLRYELKDNAGAFPNRDFIREGQINDNNVLDLRTKVHVGYTPADWANLFVEGRDAHAWFDHRDPSPDQDTFDLHQAYVKIGNTNNFPLMVIVGRQEMTYAEERFVGISDWSNTGRSFDALKLRFENDLFWVDAFVSRVVVPYDEHFNKSNDYDTFSGIYASSRKVVPWQETQLFFFSRNAGPQAPNASAPLIPGSPGSARDVYTIGGRIKSLTGHLHGWDYSTEIAGQFGSVSQGGERRDLQALAADATLGYTWTNFTFRPRFGAGYTYASGDRNFNDNKYHTFDPLFGTNHRLYGFMDLFGLRNIHNPSVSMIVKPWKPVSLRMDCLAFWLADSHDLLYPESGAGRLGNGYGRNPQFNSFVGTELDILASYQPVSWGELQCGYGHFFTGKYIRQSVNSVPANGGATDANWIYLQAKFTF